MERRAGRFIGKPGEEHGDLCPGTADRRGDRRRGSDDGKDSRHQNHHRRGAKKPAAKRTGARPANGKTTPPTPSRTVAETERIRAALAAHQEDYHEDPQQHRAEIAELQRDRLTDSAGDDQADTGSKTFEREQEISLANNILERINQVERALERLDGGRYGCCERCGNAMPVAGSPRSHPLRCA